MESLGRDLVPRRSNDSETDSNDPEQREPADPHSIITKAPTDRFKLGLLSVMSLVVNRMVGRCYIYSK
jgi:hypothetical protein